MQRSRLIATGVLSSAIRFASVAAIIVLTHPATARADLVAVRDFNIPPQSLSSALVQFSAQADVQVVGRTETLVNMKTSGVFGRFTGREALHALLDPSPVTFEEVTPASVRILPRNPNGPAPGAEPSAAKNTAAGHAALAGATASSAVEPDTQLAEVIVTAQRRVQNLQDVPASISAFSGESLQRRHITEAAQYLALAPNVSFTEDGQSGSRGLTISIRGVSNNNASKFSTTAQSTGAYLDEFSIAATAKGTVNPQLQDLERVEVLRGPQGTYFGRNSLGGALNLTTKKPTDQFEGSVAMDGRGYSTRGGQYSVTGVVNVPISDTFFARGVAYFEDNSGIVKNIVPGGGDSGHEYKMGRLSLRWLASDRTTVDIMGMFDNEHQGIDENVPSGVFDLDTAGSFFVPLSGVKTPINDGEGFWPQNQSKVAHTAIGEGTNNFSNLGVLNIQHRLSDHIVLKSVSGVMSSKTQRIFDNDLVPEDLIRQYEQREGLSWSSELRLEMKWSRNEWVLGALHADDTISKVPLRGAYGGGLGSVTGATTAVDISGTLAPVPGSGNSANGPITGPGIVDFGVLGALPPLFPIELAPGFTARLTDLTPDGKGPLCLLCNTWQDRSQSSAIFSDLTSHLTDRVDAVLGVRYTRDTIRDRYTAYNLFRVAAPPVGADKSYNDISPRASLIYAFNPEAKAYATVSKGYKAGGFSLNNQTTEATARQQEYAPEKLWNYEIGFKSTWLDRRVRANASAFYMEWTDLQFESFYFATPGDPSSFVNRTINIRGARSEGIEIETAALLTPQFTVSASAGFLDTRITSHQTAFLSASQIVDLYGQQMPRSPKWTTTLGGDYRWNWLGHDPYVRAEWSFHSGQYSTIEDVTYAQTSNAPIYVVAGDPASGRVGTVPNRSSGFPFRSPDYHLVNLSAGMNWSRSVGLRVYADNVLDQVYYTGTGENFGLSGFRLRPHPRTIGATVTVNF